MNILRKVNISLVSAVAVAATLAGCSASPSSTLPALADVIAQTSQQIASDLGDELATAKSLPRETRRIRTASVEVSEMAEVVVVEASRLPGIEHLVDVTAAQSVSF